MCRQNEDMPVATNKKIFSLLACIILPFNALLSMTYARWHVGGVLSYMQSVVYVFNKTCCITLQAVCKLWMQDNK